MRSLAPFPRTVTVARTSRSGPGASTQSGVGRRSTFFLFSAHHAGGHGSGGGDGGDDAAGDKLCLQLVHLHNAVVARAQVGACRDEVHVEVGVVVL
eukprot:4354875-Pyramimonas_sp.AAC.1